MSDFQQNADLIELLTQVANLATKTMEMAGNGRSSKLCGLIGQENSTIHWIIDEVQEALYGGVAQLVRAAES